MELGQRAMLLWNNSVGKSERDNIMRCRTFEKMKEEKEAETRAIIERLQKMETWKTPCVDTKADKTIQATRERVDKSYAKLMAVQQKEANNAHTRASTKTMSGMGPNIRKKTQGYQKTQKTPKVENLVLTIDVVN